MHLSHGKAHIPVSVDPRNIYRPQVLKYIYKENHYLNLIHIILWSFCLSVENVYTAINKDCIKRICVLAIFKLNLQELSLPMPLERPPSKQPDQFSFLFATLVEDFISCPTVLQPGTKT